MDPCTVSVDRDKLALPELPNPLQPRRRLVVDFEGYERRLRSGVLAASGPSWCKDVESDDW